MTAKVTLAARNEAPGELPQVLYVPASSTSMYTVEWIDADNLYAVGGSNQPPRPSANTLTIHSIKYGDQTSYLVTAANGFQTAPGNPFYDSTTDVRIELIGTEGSPATATVQVSVGPANPVWPNDAGSGAPPANSTKIWWVGVDKAAGDPAIPSNAIGAGYDPSAGPLYSCRTWYHGVQLGKVVWGQCAFPWGGSEHWQAGLFQTLSAVPGGSTTWVPGANGSLPPNALAAGFDGSNNLYVCRAQVNGRWTPGKFIWGQCDVSWGGKEIWNKNYEVLAVN